MSILICAFTLEDAMGNKKRLKVRMAEDGSLYYSLRARLGSTSFSIGNIQLTRPLPEMRRDKLLDTVSDIRRALVTGVYSVSKPDIYAKVDPPKPATMWVINESSASYDWLVVAETKEACIRAFSKMWNQWCKDTDADPYYWGSQGDKWGDVAPMEVRLGAGYMDRELFR